jgi:protein-tyrosine phosphatase
MDTPYKMYCMGNVLVDKLSSYMSTDNSSDIKAERLVERNRGIFGSLYDLTYGSTKIIDRLYLGNSCNARNYYDMQEDNIGLIVNSSPCISIDVKDISGANILPHLDDTVCKMAEYISNNPTKNILVHCFMGSSRSATIIIAYLIKQHQFSLNDAMVYVKEKRIVVNLNKDFYNQLEIFETSHKAGLI